MPDQSLSGSMQYLFAKPSISRGGERLCSPHLGPRELEGGVPLLPPDTSPEETAWLCWSSPGSAKPGSPRLNKGLADEGQ